MLLHNENKWFDSMYVKNILTWHGKIEHYDPRRTFLFNIKWSPLLRSRWRTIKIIVIHENSSMVTHTRRDIYDWSDDRTAQIHNRGDLNGQYTCFTSLSGSILIMNVKYTIKFWQGNKLFRWHFHDFQAEHFNAIQPCQFWHKIRPHRCNADKLFNFSDTKAYMK